MRRILFLAAATALPLLGCAHARGDDRELSRREQRSVDPAARADRQEQLVEAPRGAAPTPPPNDVPPAAAPSPPPSPPTP